MSLATHWRNRAVRRQTIAEGRLVCVDVNMEFVETVGRRDRSRIFNTVAEVLEHYKPDSEQYMADLALFSNEADEVEDEGVIVRESNVEDYSDEPFDSTNEPRCKTCEQIYTECSCKEFGA